MQQKQEIILKKASIFISAALMIPILYLLGCLLIYRNTRSIEKIKARQIVASSAAQEASHTFMHDSVFYRELAQAILYHRHKPSFVEELFEMAILKSPADPINFLAFADYLVSKGCCRNEVSALLEQAMARAPTNAEIHKTAGLYFLSAGNTKKSISSFLRMLELQPRMAKQLFRTLESKAGAESILKQTFEKIEATSLEAEENLIIAEMALECGWLDVAKRNAMAATRRQNLTAAALEMLSDTFLREKNTLEAIKYAEAAEQAHLQDGNPEKLFQAGKRSAEWLLSLAGLYDSMGNYEKSVRLYQRYAHLHPQRPQGYNLAGDAYMKMGQYSKALQLYRQALQKNPRNKHARESITRLQRLEER